MQSRKAYAAMEVPWGKPQLSLWNKNLPKLRAHSLAPIMAALRWRRAAFRDKTRSKVAFVVL